MLASAQQDLIVRVAQAYFDVLLAQFTIELTESQKAAVSENARAGQAQFRGRHGDDHRHQRSAGQVRPDRGAGDLGRRTISTTSVTALRAIIGRSPKELKRVERGLEPDPPDPNALELLGRRARSPRI